MSKKALEILAIKGDAKELGDALEKIKSRDAIVFENAVVELTIGDKKVKDTMFNCAIFSEISDVLILIMAEASASVEDAKEFLDKKGVKYHLVSFLKPKKKNVKKTSPEILFARDGSVVSNVCDEIIAKGGGDLTYEFYAEQVSKLRFKFLDSFDNLQTFDGQIIFTGTILLDNKIILLEGKTERFVIEHQQEALKILEEKGFSKTNSHNF